MLRPENVELRVLGCPLRAEWSPEVDRRSLYLFIIIIIIIIILIIII